MRQERALRTRRAILDAAASVFDERGYEAATIGEVLARAGGDEGGFVFSFSVEAGVGGGGVGGAVCGVCAGAAGE
ncbi:TetR family transcriptional regulator [Streptomyces sp. S1D4-11]